MIKKFDQFKMFEQYSSNILEDIEEVFQSLLDDFDLKLSVYECKESIVHLVGPIEYSGRRGREANKKTDVFYRYTTSVDTDWSFPNRPVDMDGHGWDMDGVKGEEEYSEETDYYIVDMRGRKFNDKEFIKILPGIRENLIRLNKLYNLTLHNCGDLYFKNGIEINGDFNEVNWMMKTQPRNIQQLGFSGGVRIAICIKEK